MQITRAMLDAFDPFVDFATLELRVLAKHTEAKHMIPPINLSELDTANREVMGRVRAAFEEMEGKPLLLDPKDGNFKPESADYVIATLKRHGVTGVMVRRDWSGTVYIKAAPRPIGLGGCDCDICRMTRRQYNREIGERIHDMIYSSYVPPRKKPYTLESLFIEPTAEQLRRKALVDLAFDSAMANMWKKPYFRSMPSVSWAAYDEVMRVSNEAMARAIYGETAEQKRARKIGLPVYVVDNQTVTTRKPEPTPIGKVVDVRPDGLVTVALNCTPGPVEPGVYQASVFKLNDFDAPKPFVPAAKVEDKPSFTSLLHMAMDRQEYPAEAEHLTGKERQTLKRMVNMLQGKNRYTQKVIAQRDEALADSKTLDEKLLSEVKVAVTGRMPQGLIPGSARWEYLSAIYKTVAPAMNKASSSDEIEKITTERLTRELVQVLTGGPAPDNDYDRSFRDTWVRTVRSLRDEKRGETHERNKLVNQTKLELAGQLARVTAGDRVTLSKDGWLGQSHWVDCLKDLASKLEDLRKQPPTVSRETVIAEAIRDVNRALDGKWPCERGPRSEWQATLDRVHMVSYNLLNQCAEQVAKALKGDVQVIAPNDPSSAAAAWRNMIAAVYRTNQEAKELEEKLAKIRRTAEE